MSNYFNSIEFYNIIYGFYSINERINLSETLNFIVSLNIKLFLATNDINIIHEFNNDLLNYYSLNNTKLCFLDYNLDNGVSLLLDNYLKKAHKTDDNEKLYEYLFNNIFKYNWKFHACNSCFLDSIKKYGINPSIMFIEQNEINELDELFKKYGIHTIVGYQKKNCENRVFFSTSPSVSYLYGINSPEWFAHFSCGGDIPSDGNHFNKKDYKKAINLVTKLMYLNGFSKQEKKKVKCFFDKCWKFFAVDTTPELVIVKEKNDFTIDMLKNNIKDRGGVLQGCFNDCDDDCPWDKPIDTKNAIYITMPKYDEIIKYINRRRKIYATLSTITVGKYKIN